MRVVVRCFGNGLKQVSPSVLSSREMYHMKEPPTKPGVRSGAAVHTKSVALNCTLTETSS